MASIMQNQSSYHKRQDKASVSPAPTPTPSPLPASSSLITTPLRSLPSSDVPVLKTVTTSLVDVSRMSEETHTVSRGSTALNSRISTSRLSRGQRRYRTRSVAASSARTTSLYSCYHQDMNYKILTLPWANTFFSPSLWRREYEKLTMAVMQHHSNNDNDNNNNNDIKNTLNDGYSDDHIAISHDELAGLNKMSATRVACCVRALPDIRRLKLFFKRRLRETKLLPYEQWEKEHRNHYYHHYSNKQQEQQQYYLSARPKDIRGICSDSVAFDYFANAASAMRSGKIDVGLLPTNATNITTSTFEEELSPLPTIWAANASIENDITVYDAFTGRRLLKINNVKPNVAISTLVHAPFRALVTRNLETLHVESPHDLLHTNTKDVINTDYVWVGFHDGSIRLFPANHHSLHNSGRNNVMRRNETIDIVFELPKFHNASIVAITRSPCHSDSGKEVDLSMWARYDSAFRYATSATSWAAPLSHNNDDDRNDNNVSSNSQRVRGVSSVNDNEVQRARSRSKSKSKSKSKSSVACVFDTREHLELICTASVDSSIAIWDVRKIYHAIELMRETQQQPQNEEEQEQEYEEEEQQQQQQKKWNGQKNKNNISTNTWMTAANTPSSPSTFTLGHVKSVRLTNAHVSSDLQQEIVTFDYFDRRNNNTSNRNTVELTIRSKCSLLKIRPIMRLKGGVSSLKTLHWVSTLITTCSNNNNATANNDELAQANLAATSQRDQTELHNSSLSESQEYYTHKQRDVQEMTRFMRREEQRKHVKLSPEQMCEIEEEMNRLLPQCVPEPVQSLRVNLLIASDNMGTIHLWNLDDELNVKTCDEVFNSSGGGGGGSSNAGNDNLTCNLLNGLKPACEEQQLDEEQQHKKKKNIEESEKLEQRNRHASLGPKWTKSNRVTNSVAFTTSTTKTLSKSPGRGNMAAAAAAAANKTTKACQLNSLTHRSVSPAVELSAQQQQQQQRQWEQRRTKASPKRENGTSESSKRLSEITTVSRQHNENQNNHGAEIMKGASEDANALRADKSKENNNNNNNESTNGISDDSSYNNVNDPNKRGMVSTINVQVQDKVHLHKTQHSTSPYRNGERVRRASPSNAINMNYTNTSVSTSFRNSTNRVVTPQQSTPAERSTLQFTKSSETLSYSLPHENINHYPHHAENNSNKMNNYATSYNVNYPEYHETKSVEFVSAARISKLQRLALQYQYNSTQSHYNNISGAMHVQPLTETTEMVSPFKDVKDFSPGKLRVGQRSASRANSHTTNTIITRSPRRSLSMLQPSREVSLNAMRECSPINRFGTSAIESAMTGKVEMDHNVNNKGNRAFTSTGMSAGSNAPKLTGVTQNSNTTKQQLSTSMSMPRAINRHKSLATKRGVSQSAITNKTSTSAAKQVNNKYDKGNQRATSMSVLATTQSRETSFATTPTSQSRNVLPQRSSTTAINAKTTTSTTSPSTTTRAKSKVNMTLNSYTSVTPTKSRLNKQTKTTTTNQRKSVMSCHNNSISSGINNNGDIHHANNKEAMRQESAIEVREKMNELLSRTASCRLNFTGGVAITGLAIDLPPTITTSLRRVAPVHETSDSLFEIPSEEQIEQRKLQNSFFVLDEDKALFLAFQQLQMYVAVEGTVIYLRCLPQWHGVDNDGKSFFAEGHNNDINNSYNNGSSSSSSSSNTNIAKQINNAANTINNRRTDEHDEEVVISKQVQMPSFGVTLCKRYVEIHSQPVTNLLLDSLRRELWICRNDGYTSIFDADTKRIISRLPHPTCTAALGEVNYKEWKRNQQQLALELSNMKVNNNNNNNNNMSGHTAIARRSTLRLELHPECEHLVPSHFIEFVAFCSRTQSIMALILRRAVENDLMRETSNLHVTFQNSNDALICCDHDKQERYSHYYNIINDNDIIDPEAPNLPTGNKSTISNSSTSNSNNTEDACSLLSQTRPYMERAANEQNAFSISATTTSNKNNNNNINNTNKNEQIMESGVCQAYLLDGRSNLSIHSRYLEIHLHHKVVLLSECKDRAKRVRSAQKGHYEMLCNNIGQNACMLLNKPEALQEWVIIRNFYYVWREHAKRFHRAHVSRKLDEIHVHKCTCVAELLTNTIHVTLIHSYFAKWREYVAEQKIYTLEHNTEELLSQYTSLLNEEGCKDNMRLNFCINRISYLAEYYTCVNAFRSWKKFTLACRTMRKSIANNALAKTLSSSKYKGLINNKGNQINNLRNSAFATQNYSSLLTTKISKSVLRDILHTAKQDVDLTSSFDSITSANSILPLAEHTLPPIISTFLDVVVDIFNARATIIHFSDQCNSQKSVIDESSLSIIEIAEANVEDENNVLLKKVAVLQYGFLPLLQGLLVTAEDVLPNLHDPAVASEVITMFISIHLCLDYILADAEELLTDIEEYELANQDDDDDNNNNNNIITDDYSEKVIGMRVNREANLATRDTANDNTNINTLTKVNDINKNNKKSSSVAYRMSMWRSRESVVNINKVFALRQQRIADTYEMYRVKPNTLCRQLMQLLAAMVMDDEECMQAMEDITMNLESFESFMAALTSD